MYLQGTQTSASYRVFELSFSRHRHLLNDLHALLPHTYKDTKLDTKSSNNYNSALNGLADLHSCNYIAFLEARKHAQDLYMYLSKAPNGPTLKFRVDNVHTMAELGFGGNCLKGGRGIVVFDSSFEDSDQEHKSLIREMLRGIFCVPSRGVRGMKPFVDRTIAVYWLDGKIWIRVYEIREADKERKEGQKEKTEISLIEIGPRFVLTPVLILEGSFGGAVIYKNAQYISGNQVRSEKRRKANVYSRRRNEADQRGLKKKVLAVGQQERVDGTLASVFR